MALWNMWRIARGLVVFEAEGGLCERFLSLASEMTPPVSLWDIHRSDHSFTATCRASEYRRLRRIAFRTGTRVRAVAKHGVPFMIRPLLRRAGVLVGAAMAIVLYWMLASRIWIVDVQVEDPVLAHRIEKHLESQGVGVGTRISDVDVASLRMNAIAQIKEINQLSLYFDSCIARVGVQLQEDSAVRPDRTPANIVAGADGRIVSMRATIGHPLVKEGEAVIKGDLLVSGVIETEHGTLLRHASAVILCETTHYLEECVPLCEWQETVDRVVEQPTLYLLGWRIPLYSAAAFDDRWTVTEQRHMATLFGTSLPLGIESKRYAHHTHIPVTHTAQEAQRLAKERLQARAAQQLGHATVREIIWDGEWQEDTYRLRATYACTEDIALTVPLG